MDLAFVITLADEGSEQLEACLSSLRKFYPKAPIHLFSDGVDNKSYPKVAAKYQAKYELGQYVKRSECGGLWWKRVLEAGLSYKKKWIIKMDTDARIWRPFRYEPKFPLSGTLENSGEARENVQGGCQAISAELAQVLLKSGILDGSELRNQRLYCPEPDFLRTWVPAGYFTTDFSMMYMVKKLGLQFGNWPEVNSVWKFPPENEGMKFAVTHPIKHKKKQIGMPPWTKLYVIVTCKGRLHHLKQTLPRFLEKNVEVTLVDYSCPDGAGKWAKSNFPQVRVVNVPNQSGFHLARARNLGAKQTPRGWYCFFDADLVLKPGWADAIRKRLQFGHYFIADPLQWSMTGSCVVHSDDYNKADGYDELITGWGCEDIDFYTRLRHIGVRPSFWPGEFGSPIVHSDRERVAHYSREKLDSQKISEDYYRRKVEWMVKSWRLPSRKDKATMLKHTHQALGIPGHPEQDEIYPSEHLREFGPLGGKPRDVSGSDVQVGHDRGETAGQNAGNFSGGPRDFGRSAGYQIGQAISSGVSANNGFRHGSGVNISVINESSVHLGYSLPELCSVGMLYLREILEQLWPGTYATLIPTKVILPHTHAIILMDDPNHNAQLGYRSRTPHGLPLSKIFVVPTLTAGKSITQVFTHELAEMRVDPDLNHTAIAANGEEHAVEICDAVDEDCFELEGYAVSNVQTRSWFQSHHQPGATKFDYMGILSRPFTLSRGGLSLVRTNGQWNKKFGSFPKSERPPYHFPNQRHIDRLVNTHAATQKMHVDYLR
jgi:hypothetical protein